MSTPKWPSATEAEILLKDYGGIIRTAVSRAMRRVRADIQADDLTAVARVALLESAANNDGVGRFEAYAWEKVRWAILDEMRRQDWLSRRQRRAHGTGSHLSHIEDLEGFEPAVQAVADKAITARMARALVDSLPTRERFVIRAIYFEGVDFGLLSAVLGVSQPRVSQLHARALARMRKLHDLETYDGEDDHDS